MGFLKIVESLVIGMDVARETEVGDDIFFFGGGGVEGNWEAEAGTRKEGGGLGVGIGWLVEVLGRLGE